MARCGFRQLFAGLCSLLVAALALAAPSPAYAAESEAHFTSFGGVPVAYYEYGHAGAPAVVLTGGWPWDSRILVSQAKDLAARGLHVIRYDQRGSGLSGHPEGIDAYSLPNLAGEFGAVIDAAAPGQPVSLVGEAWGPFIASEYASLHPGRVTSLTSIGAPSFDLAAAELKRNTREIPGHPEKLEPTAAQWAALSYFFAVDIPIVPEAVIRTGAPTAVVNAVTDFAENDATLIRENPLALTQTPTNARDTEYGINKYRWFVNHRIFGPVERDYLPIDRVQVFQLTQDPIETPLLIENLAGHTPHLTVRSLEANHLTFTKGKNLDIVDSAVAALVQ